MHSGGNNVVTIGFTQTLHKALVTLSSIASLVGAYIVSADQVPFGWDAFDVGLTLIWTGGIATIVSTSLRENWLPGVNSGVGTE